jgi:hypothetical protein
LRSLEVEALLAAAAAPSHRSRLPRAGTLVIRSIADKQRPRS